MRVWPWQAMPNLAMVPQAMPNLAMVPQTMPVGGDGVPWGSRSGIGARVSTGRIEGPRPGIMPRGTRHARRRWPM